MEVDPAGLLTTKVAKVAKTAKKDGLVSRSFVCARYATGAFALLTLLSMSLYPGGTYLNPDSGRHLFLQNFLSDLGMPRSWGGEVNPWGALLFVSAEVILAIGLIAFFVGVLQLLGSVPNARRWARLATIVGVSASLVLVAAAFTPANRFLLVHVEMVVFASYGATLAAVFLVFALSADPRFPRSSLIAAALVAVVVASYAAVIEWGPTVDSVYGLTFQVTAQKITFAVLLAGIACLSFVAERLSTHA